MVVCIVSLSAGLSVLSFELSLRSTVTKPFVAAARFFYVVEYLFDTLHGGGLSVNSRLYISLPFNGLVYIFCSCRSAANMLYMGMCASNYCAVIIRHSFVK